MSDKSFLALDTGSTTCSVALSYQGESIELSRNAPRKHNRLLLPLINRVLAQGGVSLSQLDGIICNIGPGSPVGVRLGIATGQSLAYAADLPVYAVSSLKALVIQGQKQGQKKGFSEYLVLPCVDARLNQVYWAGYLWPHTSKKSLTPHFSSERIFYGKGLPQEVQSETLSDRLYFCEKVVPVVCSSMPVVKVGPGWQKISPHGNMETTLSGDSSAQNLIDWIAYSDTEHPMPPERLQPLYLRQAVP